MTNAPSISHLDWISPYCVIDSAHGLGPALGPLHSATSRAWLRNPIVIFANRRGPQFSAYKTPNLGWEFIRHFSRFSLTVCKIIKTWQDVQTRCSLRPRCLRHGGSKTRISALRHCIRLCSNCHQLCQLRKGVWTQPCSGNCTIRLRRCTSPDVLSSPSSLLTLLRCFSSRLWRSLSLNYLLQPAYWVRLIFGTCEVYCEITLPNVVNQSNLIFDNTVFILNQVSCFLPYPDPRIPHSFFEYHKYTLQTSFLKK